MVFIILVAINSVFVQPQHSTDYFYMEYVNNYKTAVRFNEKEVVCVQNTSPQEILFYSLGVTYKMSEMEYVQPGDFIYNENNVEMCFRSSKYGIQAIQYIKRSRNADENNASYRVIKVTSNINAIVVLARKNIEKGQELSIAKPDEYEMLW